MKSFTQIQFTENKLNRMESIRNVCSLQASALNICASIVLSNRFFKIKYSHQSKHTFTEKKK